MQLTWMASTWVEFPDPGSVVSIPFYGVLRHEGIVSDRWSNGKPMVISNSQRSGTVVEESWDDFAGGKEVRFDGYPGDLIPFEVLQRARSLKGELTYQLFTWNCQHLTTFAHGLPARSHQAEIALGILLAGAAIWVKMRK